MNLVFSKDEIEKFYNLFYKDFPGQYIYLKIDFRFKYTKKDYNMNSKQVDCIRPWGSFKEYPIKEEIYQLSDFQSFYEEIYKFAEIKGIYDDNHTLVEEGYVLYLTIYTFTLEDLRDFSKEFIKKVDFTRDFKQIRFDFYRELQVKKSEKSDFLDIDVDFDFIEDPPNLSLIPQSVRDQSNIVKTRKGFHVIFKKENEDFVIQFFNKYLSRYKVSWSFYILTVPLPGTLQGGYPVVLGR